MCTTNCYNNMPFELVIQCEFVSINEKAGRKFFYNRVYGTTFPKSVNKSIRLRFKIS